MKDIDIFSTASTFSSLAPASNSIHTTSDGTSEGTTKLVELQAKVHTMFQLPPPEKRDSILNDVRAFGYPFTSAIDFCDNSAQVDVLRHHYLNEFGRQDGEEEVLKDYRKDSIIYNVIDDMPSTYRGKSGAAHAWHDLCSHIDGPCNFDLTHISVCKNHAQVYWKAESGPNHVVVHGTDSFTFDGRNHIKMQSTVAMSEK